MHLNPGVPIMSSLDLMNWELISYAHQALDQNHSKLNLNGDNAYGKGTWASSIQYKNGLFYVMSFSYTTDKTYIWVTADITSDRWQQHTINQVFHDGSLLFDDDGRNYLAFGSDEIKLIELTPEGTGILPGALPKTLIQSASAIAGKDFILTAEGTQLQKINGWYYLSNICWPKGQPRTQVVHRSRNITGPYEGRVVLQANVNGAGIAQGAYISTPQKQWYLYAFRDSGAVGRIPYLIPITWQDNWPVVSDKVQSALTLDHVQASLEGIIRSDEFNRGDLDLAWQWNHNPDHSGWSLTERAGFLRVTNTRIEHNIHDTRNSLTQRMFGPVSTGIVKLDLRGLVNGDVAGLAAFQDQYGYVGVTQSNGQKYVIMVDSTDADPREIERIPIDQQQIYLRISADFRHQSDTASFAYSTNGETWSSIGKDLSMTYKLTHFMGFRFALFNYATQNVGGYVDFDYFHIVD